MDLRKSITKFILNVSEVGRYGLTSYKYYILRRREHKNKMSKFLSYKTSPEKKKNNP